MGSVRSLQHDVTLLHDALGLAVVDLLRREQSERAVAMLGVVPVEEAATETARILEAAEALGNCGRYFSVLKWLSLKGLSFETCGLL